MFFIVFYGRSALSLMLDCFNCLSLGQNLANHSSWVKSSPLPITVARELKVFFTFLKVEIKPIEDEFVTHEIHM